MFSRKSHNLLRSILTCFLLAPSVALAEQDAVVADNIAVSSADGNTGIMNLSEASQGKMAKAAEGETIASWKGQWKTEEDGSFSYNFPIEVLAGRQGVQPSLSLSYNSRAGTQMLGKGWGLGGFPAIVKIAHGRGIQFDGDSVVRRPSTSRA